jgi:uncharacterized protein YdaL
MVFFLCGVMAGLAWVEVVAEPLVRPPTGKGAGAKTLILYSAIRTPYSLGDNLEALKLQLRRVATQLEALPISEAASNQLAAADYLVIFCPQPAPTLSTNVLELIAQSRQPVLWIGFGVEGLKPFSPFTNQFQISPRPADQPAAKIHYREQEWEVPFYPWIPVMLLSNSAATVLMTVSDAGTNQPAQRVACWRTNNFTFFAGVPVGTAMNVLFADLLLDFFQVTDLPPTRLFLRIEDYSALSDHREFQRMADYLHAHKVPFVVAVIPVIRNSDSGDIEGLDTRPEFVAALRYAQQRGGRLLLHGYRHAHGDEPGEGHEFWDTERDRPLAEDKPEYTRERIHKGVSEMLKHGLIPLAWETPHYAASRQAYIEIAKVFSTAVEQVQLSDTTHLDKGVTAALTLDAYGRLIVPENLGYVRLGAVSNACEAIRTMVQRLTKLRGSVGGCYIHAYQPLEKLMALVEMLEQFEIPFLDLADLDHTVVLPEKILLIGKATRRVTLRNATIHRQVFNRRGKLLVQEQEPAATNGERTFQRSGVGDYELLEFVEPKP